MLPGTSPNDPVFFLNHAKEDELWAVWTQKHQGVPHYLPLDSEPLPAGHTHLKRLSDHMDALAEYFGGGTLDRVIDLLDHKSITWYDTDLPEITLESGPALAFHDTPAGLPRAGTSASGYAPAGRCSSASRACPQATSRSSAVPISR